MSRVAREPESTDRALQPLTPDEEAVVRSLSRVVYVLPRAIDADMLREQRLSLTEYMALVHLSEASHRQLRMSELAAAIEMSISGTTRIAHRLESQGLIRRVRSEEDARGWNAMLTDAGFARLEEAWPTNLASVRRHFLDHLDGLDLKKLAAAMRSVAT